MTDERGNAIEYAHLVPMARPLAITYPCVTLVRIQVGHGRFHSVRRGELDIPLGCGVFE